MMKQQQADQLAQAQKVRASWMAVYERASQKQQAGTAVVEQGASGH